MALAEPIRSSIKSEPQTVEHQSLEQSYSKKRKHGTLCDTEIQCLHSRLLQHQSGSETREGNAFPPPAAPSMPSEPAQRRKSLYDVPEYIPPVPVSATSIRNIPQQVAAPLPHVNPQRNVPSVQVPNVPLRPTDGHHSLRVQALRAAHANSQGHMPYVQPVGGPVDTRVSNHRQQTRAPQGPLNFQGHGPNIRASSDVANIDLGNHPQYVQAQHFRASETHTSPHGHAPFIPGLFDTDNKQPNEVMVTVPEVRPHAPVPPLQKQHMLDPNAHLYNVLDALYPFLLSIECAILLLDGTTIKTSQVYKDRHGMYAVYQTQHQTQPRKDSHKEMYTAQLKLTSTTQELKKAFMGTVPYLDRTQGVPELSNITSVQLNPSDMMVVWSGVGPGTSCTSIRPGDHFDLHKALDLIRLRGFRDHLRMTCQTIYM